MKIFEEYQQRHKIIAPLIYYPNFGCLIFKTNLDKGHPWFVFTIEWENQSAHPGKYVFSLRSPLNSRENQDLCYLSKNHFTIQRSWAEYEDYLFDFLHYERKTLWPELSPIFDDKELILTTWEIFVCSYEYWFSNQSYITKKLLFKTIDLDSNLDKRLFFLDQFLKLDCFVDSKIHKVWLNSFLYHVQNHYLSWVKNL